MIRIAKELFDRDSLLMIGGGPKGTDPIVFQDGGKGNRAFLEGRVDNDGYIVSPPAIPLLSMLVCVH